MTAGIKDIQIGPTSEYDSSENASDPIAMDALVPSRLHEPTLGVVTQSLPRKYDVPLFASC